MSPRSPRTAPPAGRPPRAVHRRPALADPEAGVIAVITALLAVVLFVFAAIAVDVGRWYSEGQRLQRAVDAAALAGAPYLPGDLTRARAEARKLLALNGYDASTAAVPDSNITIGDRASRLQVTASSTIPNAFGTVIGARFKTVTRSAVADFAASVTVGSPCNLLGNTPPGPSSPSVGGPSCPSNPSFWNSIAGPDTLKVWGDQYATRRCEGGESNCAGSRNLDYSGGAGIVGQSYYVYRIRAARSVAQMKIEVFDPMFVDVGNHCEIRGKLKPGVVTSTDNPLWVLGPTPLAPDAEQRYAWGDATTTPKSPGTYCTGDTLTYHAPLGASPTAAQLAAAQKAESDEARKLNTTFLVLNPTDTLDPMRSTPVAGCAARSFRGFSGDLEKALLPGTTSYVPAVAQNFRQWVSMCTITAPQVGRDYYLLVRTNVPAGASAARMLDPAEDASTGGDGFNRYGLRVSTDAPDAVSLSALERLPIYANLTELTKSAQFPIARVSSANAGGVLTVAFFDTGDASDPASIAIKDPAGKAPVGCTATGDVRQSPTGDFSTSTCTLSNVFAGNGYQGKIQRIRVPVPSDYTCKDAEPTACWYRLTISYPAGAVVNDGTTWSASLDGDPVRLVK